MKKQLLSSTKSKSIKEGSIKTMTKFTDYNSKTGEITEYEIYIPKKYEVFENNEWVYKKELEDLDKLIKLREVRDYILQRAAWISQRWNDELYAVGQGLITEEQMSCSKELFINYLLWKKEYCDLPITVNLDDYDLNDINETNKSIFRDCPIDLRLTKIGDN